MSLEECKKAAAEKAVSFVKSSMKIGLGTGSTTGYFIDALIAKHRQGVTPQVVASSTTSYLLAENGGLPLLDPLHLTSLDLYVDGADAINPEKQMIKGGGGALLREKILAHMSREIVIIVDETKLVSKLGGCRLPVEIIPFGSKATIHHLQQLGYRGHLRYHKDGSPWVTENHNFLYDIDLSPSSTHPVQDHEKIRSVPGVVETGFFLNQAGWVIIGFKDGSVVVQ